MLESKIEALTAAINRLADSLAPVTITSSLAPEPPKAKGRAAKAPATVAEDLPKMATEPVATQAPTPSPTAPKADPKLLLSMTNAIIKLANEHDHDAAIAILAKRKVKRCSEIPEGEWQAVLDEAEEAIAAAEAAAAKTSLV